MAKRKFILTEVERKELLGAYLACKDAGTRTRYQAVRRMAKAIPQQKSNKSLDVTEPV